MRCPDPLDTCSEQPKFEVYIDEARPESAIEVNWVNWELPDGQVWASLYTKKEKHPSRVSTKVSSQAPLKKAGFIYDCCRDEIRYYALRRGPVVSPLPCLSPPLETGEESLRNYVRPVRQVLAGQFSSVCELGTERKRKRKWRGELLRNYHHNTLIWLVWSWFSFLIFCFPF